MQQVRKAWCDGNREINESRSTLIGSELISNRGYDTINLSLLFGELHLSLSSFYITFTPLPLFGYILSFIFSLCVHPPLPLPFHHLRSFRPFVTIPLYDVPHIVYIYIFNELYIIVCIYTHLYIVYSKND